MIDKVNVRDRLSRFMTNLEEGAFDDQLSTALADLERVLEEFGDARRYLVDEYFPTRYRESRGGREHLSSLASHTLEHPLPTLAHLIVRAFISFFDAHSESRDESSLRLLIEVIIRYRYGEYLALENIGQNLRFESASTNFSLPVEAVRTDIRVEILLVLLEKYTSDLIDSCPPPAIELPTLIQRLNSTMTALSNLDRDVLLRRSRLLPFHLLYNQLAYSKQRAYKLFKETVSIEQYENELYRLFLIPLFPIIEPDKLEFLGRKFSFRNEGMGYLPHSRIDLIVGEESFQLAVLNHIVEPAQVEELYLENHDRLGQFLIRQDPNDDVKVGFSFEKYGCSYKFELPAKKVGAWKERVSVSFSDRGMPHPLQLDVLSERNFERLCYWIVEEGLTDINFIDVVWLNEEGGPERGRDIVATETITKRSWAFQCKHGRHFGPADIEKELQNFANYIEEDASIKPDVYVLVHSGSITDAVKSRGDRLAEEIGMQIKYWSNAKIDKLVRDKSKLMDRFWTLMS